MLGDQTTDENELNEAGFAIFGSDWMGVYASNEIPPSSWVLDPKYATTHDERRWALARPCERFVLR